MGGSENIVIIISVDTLTCIKELKTSNCVNGVRFNSDGTLLCAVGDYGMTAIWATDTWDIRPIPDALPSEKRTFWGVAFTSERKTRLLQLPMVII